MYSRSPIPGGVLEDSDSSGPGGIVKLVFRRIERVERAGGRLSAIAGVGEEVGREKVRRARPKRAVVRRSGALIASKA
jgi:hypothetical protein